MKPWVKFGISPFGIYRNQKSDPLGSNTNGLQNYDDLYADVLLWAREGWIDYNIPQIYWEIGHKAADYETLVKWWATHSENRPLFIGQSVTNTIQHADPQNPSMNQLPGKWLYSVLTRRLAVAVNGMRQLLLKIREDIAMRWFRISQISGINPRIRLYG